MVINEISEIRKKRKRLGISQSKLAEEAGFSQSMIARIERGDVDPRFSTYKKIKTAMKELKNENSKKASDLMSCPVIFVKPGDKVSKVSDKMIEEDISQMPVLKNEKEVGSIRESTIIDKTSGSNRKEDLSERKVEEIMEPPFPVLSEKAEFEEVLSILKSNQAVLISEKGEISGIVTRANIIDLL